MSSAHSTVIITGASSGIGRALAVHFAKSKVYKLALFARNLKRLNETIRYCKNENPNVQIFSDTLDWINF